MADKKPSSQPVQTMPVCRFEQIDLHDGIDRVKAEGVVNGQKVTVIASANNETNDVKLQLITRTQGQGEHQITITAHGQLLKDGIAIDDGFLKKKPMIELKSPITSNGPIEFGHSESVLKAVEAVRRAVGNKVVTQDDLTGFLNLEQAFEKQLLKKESSDQPAINAANSIAKSKPKSNGRG